MFSLSNVLRWLILAVCLVLSVLYFIAPNLLVTRINNTNVYLVLLMIIGICIGFVYGTGYKPKFKFWRFFVNPIMVIIIIFVPFLLLHFIK